MTWERPVFDKLLPVVADGCGPDMPVNRKENRNLAARIWDKLSIIWISAGDCKLKLEMLERAGKLGRCAGEMN